MQAIIGFQLKKYLKTLMRTQETKNSQSTHTKKLSEVSFD